MSRVRNISEWIKGHIAGEAQFRCGRRLSSIRHGQQPFVRAIMIAAAARSQKPGRRPPRSQFGYGQSHIGCGVLNRREREVIMETCLGLTNKEFARKLEIGLHTAATDRKRAYQRLGVNNSRDLIKAVLFPN